MKLMSHFIYSNYSYFFNYVGRNSELTDLKKIRWEERMGFRVLIVVIVLS